MANDFFSTIRTHLSKLTDGDKSAAEVRAVLNQWMRDGSGAIKVKIEDEVERSVSKMGFVKRGEFEALKEEVARLKSVPKKTGAKKAPVKKSAGKKSEIKKTPVKKPSK